MTLKRLQGPAPRSRRSVSIPGGHISDTMYKHIKPVVVAFGDNLLHYQYDLHNQSKIWVRLLIWLFTFILVTVYIGFHLVEQNNESNIDGIM